MGDSNLEKEVLLQLLKVRRDSNYQFAMSAWMWMVAIGAVFFMDGFAVAFGWDDLGAAINLLMGILFILLGVYFFRKTPSPSFEEHKKVVKRIKELETDQ